MVKNLFANVRCVGSMPGSERSHVPQGNEARVPQPLSPCSRAQAPQIEKPEPQGRPTAAKINNK